MGGIQLEFARQGCGSALCHNKGQCARVQGNPSRCHMVLFHHIEERKVIFFAVALKHA